MLFYIKICSYFHNLKYFFLSLNVYVLIRVMNHDWWSKNNWSRSKFTTRARVCTR